MGSAPLPILLLDSQIHTASEQEVMANSEGAEQTDLGQTPAPRPTLRFSISESRAAHL